MNRAMTRLGRVDRPGLLAKVYLVKALLPAQVRIKLLSVADRYFPA